MAMYGEAVWYDILSDWEWSDWLYVNVGEILAVIVIFTMDVGYKTY